MKNLLNKLLYFVAASIFLMNCSQQDFLETPRTEETVIKAATTSPGSCSSCTYVVPSSSYTQIVDGKKLGLDPGDVICLSAANNYTNIIFRNVVGSSSNPIIITNCGGTVTLTATGKPFNIKTEYSKYFKITGGSGTTHGIRLNGGHMGMTLEKLSSDFEVNNIEVFNSGFAGIMAKTDPTCDEATNRGNFTMRNVSIHDNYVHDTGGEGLYVGNSFYENGMSLSCGRRLPHTIEGLKIFNNRIVKPGWEGIQVGCAISGAYVYNNTIEDFGSKNVAVQNNGLQFSEGTKGIAYGNLIKDGPGIGINIVGYGDSFVHNNIVINAGSYGIFCDERATRNLPGFRIINNTIISPGIDGMRMYNEYVPGIIYNNIIVDPGYYSKYVYPRSGEDAYVYKLGKSIPMDIQNNIFTRDINMVKFLNTSDFRITSASPALNKGKDIRSFNIQQDYFGNARLAGSAYDIGANEYGAAVVDEEIIGDDTHTVSEPVEEVGTSEDDGTNIAPKAYSGKDETIYLPQNSLILHGSGTDSDGSIASYSWSKRSGGVVTMTGTNTKDLNLSGMVEGSYVFVLTVRDNDGATHSDAMMVTVKQSLTTTENKAPIAYSGKDKVLYWPQNSVTIYGSGKDSDGTISSYSWTKRSGGTVSMSGTNSKNLSISNMVKGSYVFVLTVRDNDGAVHSDAMMVTVK